MSHGLEHNQSNRLAKRHYKVLHSFLLLFKEERNYTWHASLKTRVWFKRAWRKSRRSSTFSFIIF